MPPLIDQEIRRVLVVDDDKDLREQCGELLRDMDMEPVFPGAPLRDVQEVLNLWHPKVDAMICDYRLNIKKGFADFNGDLLVAPFNLRGKPGLLCTSYTDVDITLPRSRRRDIPVLLPSGAFDQKQIRGGFAQCQHERRGIFVPSREPWRTLICVTDVADDERPPYFHVEVPAWEPDKKVRVDHEAVPEELRAKIRPGQYLHARVNIGAKHHVELYFTDWEGE